MNLLADRAFLLKIQADDQPRQQENGEEKIFFHGLMYIFTV